MMRARAWWRRNTVALVALVVLVPATALILGGWEWWKVNQQGSLFPAVAAAGAEVDFAGTTWGPATIEEVPAAPGADLPAGARVVHVTIPVEPGSAPPSCSSPMLREAEGAGREWADAVIDVDWDYEHPSSCYSEDPGPFTMVVPYLIPADARGPFVVDLAVADELPRFLRFEVVP